MKFLSLFIHPKYFSIVSSLLALMVVASPLGAKLPNKPSGYVTDQAGVLDANGRYLLEQGIMELKQKTGAEMAVVTIPSLQNETIERFAVDLFEKWGIGQKGKDNGILFLVSLEDRQMRIEVGYGLEGLIPDGRAGRIRDEIVLPAFRKDSYSTGIIMGTREMAMIIAEDKNVALSVFGQLKVQPDANNRTRSQKKAGWLERIISLIFLVGFILIAIRHPWLALFFLMGGRGGRWGGGGGFGGGGFGGFGGGMSGGGGVSGRW